MSVGSARAHGAVVSGVRGCLVDVEVDISHGLPSIGIVGLPDTSVGEARHRVRCAIENSGLTWPVHRITVSLTPAEVRKSGSGLDLAIALGILGASGQLVGADLGSCVVLGELGLDGSLHAAAGALAMVVAARDAGMTSAFVAAPALHVAMDVPGISVVGVHSLAGLVRRLCGLDDSDMPEYPGVVAIRDDAVLAMTSAAANADPDLVDVRGHQDALLALEVAAAGRHHLALIGPPGVGKSMIATRVPTLLPDLTAAEALEVAVIYGVAGLPAPGLRPPTSAPHHSASAASVLGSVRGSRVAPGAVTLAHLGCLVLDEAPEFARPSLEGLRQPLESGTVWLQRAGWSGQLPARFQLILTANPCPCGHRIDTGALCTCSSVELRRYRAKLSGPLMDRVDVRLQVGKPSPAQARHPMGDSSAVVRERVVLARERSRHRFAGCRWEVNAEIPSRELRRSWAPDAAGIALLDDLERESRGLRGPDRIVRMAWTLCDLQGRSRPGRDEVAIALAMRTSFDGALA